MINIICSTAEQTNGVSEFIPGISVVHIALLPTLLFKEIRLLSSEVIRVSQSYRNPVQLLLTIKPLLESHSF